MATRNHLLDVVAHLEANLDFTDEPDVDLLGRAALAGELQHAATTLEDLERRLTDRDRGDGRPRVVLFGPPNVGKSRLYNALIGDGQAIVSPQPGTTRDYLSALCDCDGLTVELVDTAGVEVAGDSITAQAQALRRLQVERADLLLVCRAADSCAPHAAEPTARCRRLLVWTKSDQAMPGPGGGCAHPIITSAATGFGLRDSAIGDRTVDSVRRNREQFARRHGRTLSGQPEACVRGAWASVGMPRSRRRRGTCGLRPEIGRR